MISILLSLALTGCGIDGVPEQPDTCTINFPITMSAEIDSLYDAGTVNGTCQDWLYAGLDIDRVLGDTTIWRTLMNEQWFFQHIDDTSDILNATLYLYADTVNGQTDSLCVSLVGSDWNPNECDWTNRKTDSTWTASAGDLTGLAICQPSDGADWYIYTVTDFLKSIYNGDTYGFVVHTNETTFNDYYVIRPPCNCECEYVPYIRITYICDGVADLN